MQKVLSNSTSAGKLGDTQSRLRFAVILSIESQQTILLQYTIENATAALVPKMLSQPSQPLPSSSHRFSDWPSIFNPFLFSHRTSPTLLKITKMRIFMFFAVEKCASKTQSYGPICDYDPILNSCTCHEQRNPFLQTKPPKAKRESWFSQLVQYRLRQRLLNTSRNDYDQSTPSIFDIYELGRGSSTPHRSTLRPSVDWRRHTDTRGSSTAKEEEEEEDEVAVWWQSS